ncbi:MAG: MFS transporter, partial [Phototrophicaceae bacterium]
MMLIGRRRFAGLEVWQRNLVIVFIAQMVSAIGFSLIFPFLPLYVADLGTNTGLSLEFWAGMVFSAQAFTMMLVSPVWGALADRYGRKMMVQRAMFGASITILLMAFVRTSEELVLLRAIQGLIAGTVSAANALVAASAPRERTGFAMGLLQVALWSGVALGPLIGGVMADAFGFRMPFIITAVMLAIGGILVLVGVHEEFTPESRQANKSKSIVSEWGHVVHMPGVVQTYAVRFLTALSKSMVVPIMPLFVAMLMLNNFTGAYLIPQP